jgi:ActR/RegA family two-component response regulator
MTGAGARATPTSNRSAVLRRTDRAALIVDDSSGFLRAARALLEQEGLAVVGDASTGEETVRTSTCSPCVPAGLDGLAGSR